jgi:hypothetical protein
MGPPKYHRYIMLNDMKEKTLTTPFSRALQICRRSNQRMCKVIGNLTAVIVYIPTYHSLDVEYWTGEELKAGSIFSPAGYISMFVERL